jgi:hypothetical protein
LGHLLSLLQLVDVLLLLGVHGVTFALSIVALGLEDLQFFLVVRNGLVAFIQLLPLCFKFILQLVDLVLLLLQGCQVHSCILSLLLLIFIEQVYIASLASFTLYGGCCLGLHLLIECFQPCQLLSFLLLSEVLQSLLLG